PVDQLTETPFALIGSPAKIVDDLLARRERWGFSYVIVGPEEIDSFAPVIAELAGRRPPSRCSAPAASPPPTPRRGAPLGTSGSPSRRARRSGPPSRRRSGERRR